MSLGSDLRAARTSRGWSLREAERHSGVANAHISQIETGAIQCPSLTVLAGLAGAYGIPLRDLVAGDGVTGEPVSDSEWVEANCTTLEDIVTLYRELRETRAALARAAGEAVTEWGVRYTRPGGEHITWYGDGESAEATARRDARQKPGPRRTITLMQRLVSYGQWAEVGDDGEPL